MKIAYPSVYLKERRTELGLEPCEVALRAGLSQELYRQIESRGQLPDDHLPKLAAALEVTEEKLKAEKVAAIVEAMFKIPRIETCGFIARAARK
jgi:transcriptional regulator with XRE-family HTH domain